MRPTAERDMLLDHLCAGDAALREEVNAQVQACEAAARSSKFLVDPAAVAFARLVRDAPAQSEHADRIEELRAALADRYAIEHELGRGGTATVYAARDHRHGRQVALKVLDTANGVAVSAERFLREIRVTAALTHPNVLPLHDSGETAGQLYYVMPYVDGETLRERLARERPIPLDASLRILQEVASALDYAHRHGVIHRDIKPANVLLADGHAIVADFGIARAVRRARTTETADAEPPAPGAGAALTFGGDSPGTPAYMAPEQARPERGEEVDERADLYAFGMVAYEVLTGTHPFGTRALPAMIEAHLHEVPPALAEQRPDLPAELAAAVMRCLAKDPAGRPASASELVVVLGRARSHVEAPPRTTRPPASRGVIVGSTFLAAVILALVLAAWFGGAWHRGDGPLDVAAAPIGVRNHTRDTTRAAAFDAGRGTRDQEAYDLYLKGRYYWVQRGPANMPRAISYFQQAIARDPRFARAHAGLSMAYGLYPIFLPGGTDSITALAMASARRAIMLDSTLADAQLALGLALDMQHRFPEALAYYRVGAALDPGSVTAHHYLGASLLNLGRTGEALVELRRATELDPRSASTASALATTLLYGRRYSEAIDAAHHAIALDSTFRFATWTLGVAQAFGGAPDSAVVTLERAASVAPDDEWLASGLLFAYAAAGRWSDADRFRQRLRDRRTNQPPEQGLGFDTSFAALVFGDRAPLVHLMTSEAGQRRLAATGALIGCDPLFDPLWSDAAFRASMRSMGIQVCALARPWPVRR